MSKKISVGIVDDHKLFRSGVVDIINDSKDFQVKISASTGDEFFSALKKSTIQILLLDINLKHENGLDILIQLSQSNPEIKVVMLTMFSESSYINTMILKGAKGYLLKDTTPEILLMTLQKVHTEGKYYDSFTTNAIVETMQSKEKLASLGIELTQIEQDILKYISGGKTADEISLLLFKSTRTIEGYRQKLLEKTKTRNVAELVSWGFKNKIL
ncbi:MAG: response regulator transcription factor [Saprospiraceae bacterium]|nr:response regulator transcription factor [Saprospiraceae bacterium]